MSSDLSSAPEKPKYRLRPSLVSILTDQTCGESCWHAREEICRCSCGGENHGCLKTANGEQPVRTCKIAGERYELLAVGWLAELGEQARKMNEQGWRYIDASIPEHRYHYTYRETDDGAPARLKTAPAAAIEKWPELRAYRDHEDFLNRIRAPYVLWRRIETPPFYFCPDQCERCDKLRQKNA